MKNFTVFLLLTSVSLFLTGCGNLLYLSKLGWQAIHCQEDDLLFSQWIDQACQQLSRFYSREISKDEKLIERKELFQHLKEEFMEKMASLKTGGYRNFEKVDINNAVLLAYRRYFHRLEKFEVLYEQFGRDTRRVVEYFKTIRATEDRAALQSFLE